MEISFLPADLPRWDQAPRGDVFAVPVWSDVRPLRGAAGLLDWRLCGQLSECLRGKRFLGDEGERLLLPTRRIPWHTVLAIGMGPSGAFSEMKCQEALAAIFTSLRGLGLRRLACALPGRDVGRIEPDRALAMLRAVAEKEADSAMISLTVIDSPAACKIMNAMTGTPRPPHKHARVAGQDPA